MAIVLGKNGTAPPFGADVISATYTEEAEVIDITNRSNAGTGVGYRQFKVGFTSRQWEIECHDATGVMNQLTSNTAQDDFIVMNVTENIGIDGAVTYTITAREGGIA